MGLNIKDFLDIGGDATASGWQWREKFVQKDTNDNGANNFVYGESTLIIAGPSQIGDTLDVTKIGLAPSINFSQQIPQQRIYEIGSRRCHILQGIPMGGASVNRMLYNGPSLLRAFYGSLYSDDGELTQAGSQSIVGDMNAANQAQLGTWKKLLSLSASDRVLEGHKNTKQWLSLWDPRLQLAFGLGVVFQDILGGIAGGMYAEGAKVSQQGFGAQSGQIGLVEGLNLTFDRLVPITVNNN